MNREKLLAKLVERLQQAYGRSLLSVLLYGSAATSTDFHQRHSDLNILCVLRELTLEDLERAEPVANWWRAQGNPAPLLLARAELEHSTDVFPVEFLDIHEQHRVLHGEDLVRTVRVDPVFHRVQVEHELRAKLLALRQRYLGIYRDRKAVLKLMVDALPSLTTLFRHALILAGWQAVGMREALQGAGQRFGFDPAPFLAILDAREGKRKHRGIDVRSTFQGYCAGLARVSEEVDKLEKRGGGA